jgi:branched-chain amino acid aminotransferase
MVENPHFPKAKIIWQMGNLVPFSESFVHSMSHALHYGNSVFEGIRAYGTPKGPAIFRLPDHIDRFMYSASVLFMDVPYKKQEISEAIKTVMKENKLDSAYIRPLLFYSIGNLGLVAKVCPVELVIGAWEWGAYLGEKTELGVHVYILPWKRIHHSQFDMKAKLGGLYILSTIGGTYVRNKGFDEAVFLNLEGNIAEGPGENIFIVKNDVLKTNDRSESILQGITRETILKIADDNGISSKIGPITKEEFFSADEAFFSGTAAEIAPILKVTDGSDPDDPQKEYTIGTGKRGKTTEKLASLYHDTVRGKINKYESWLTYVNG